LSVNFFKNMFQNKKILVLSLIVLVVLIVGIYFLIPRLNLKKESPLTEQYQKVKEITQNLESQMKADVEGGKTPEETLKLFADALKNGNIDLAVKYTKIDTKNSRSNWYQILSAAKTNGKLLEFANLLSLAVYDEKASYDGVAWFKLVDQNGTHLGDISLELNKYTGVWKISEM